MKHLFVIALVCSSLFARSDEGMWLLNMLDKLNLEQKGLKISTEQIYSINNACLKDAVMGLGDADSPFRFFCSSELISDQGLLMTNHHCGYHIIQKHAKVGENFLEDGFWAETLKDELPNKGTTASRMVYMVDVTDSIIPHINFDSPARARAKLLDSLYNSIVSTHTKDNHYSASVKSLFNNNQYILFVYETFKDVRLVGAPPSAIGKYGDEQDNWMWPRHTGDFSLFRIYTDKEGKPADYNADNVPYKPLHHFPVSLKGYKKGDFTMVMGFPGSTERYLSSHGIKQALEYSNPASIKVRRAKLDVIESYMEDSEDISIKYATKTAQISNYWKYYIGQNKGIKKLDVIKQKQNAENTLNSLIQEKYTDKRYHVLLDSIKMATEANNDLMRTRRYIIETVFGSSAEVLTIGYHFFELLDILEKDEIDIEAKNNVIKTIKEDIKEVFSECDITVEKALTTAVLELYSKDVPPHHHPEFFTYIKDKKKGDFEAFTQHLFKKSFMDSEEEIIAFLESPSEKKILKDPAFQVLSDWRDTYWGVMGHINKNKAIINRCNRLLVKATKEIYPDSIMYPDANSTIRFTYGYVNGYNARDAVEYDYFTTANGILEKENPNDKDFIVPKKLKELILNKDFGNYANEEGELPVCFISNNDITGGNSGSPVLNAEGHIIGCAFDGNWEAMSGDIIFEKELQYTISVDVRYILFVIEKYAGSKRLIDEMTIIK